MHNQPIFQLQALSCRYHNQKQPTLEKIDWTVHAGEFVLITGANGCGKSTLAQLLGGFWPSLLPAEIEGSFTFRGRKMETLPAKEFRASVGMIFQNPSRQMLTSSVEAELVLGMENLGFSPPKMRRRLAEVSALFGCTHLLEHSPSHLSGGEQQRVAIASAIAMAPEVLILDEPLSQLDPLSAIRILEELHRLHRDLGTTILLIEQRIDECFPFANRITHLQNGKISHDTSPANFLTQADPQTHFFFPALHRLLPTSTDPLADLRKSFPLPPPSPTKETSAPLSAPCLEIANLSYRYPNQKNTLQNVSLQISQREIFCLLGENGAGKSTFLKLLLKHLPPLSGKIRLNQTPIFQIPKATFRKQIAYLPQHSEDFFFADTVEEEIRYSLADSSPGSESETHRIDAVLSDFTLLPLRNSNPRHLSAGERQRVALACILASHPQGILADEPTCGMDPASKLLLIDALKTFAATGGFALIVTQDTAFTSEVADRCGLLFRGEIATLGTPQEIFSEGLFYTTPIAKALRRIHPTIVSLTAAQALLARKIYQP